MVRFRPPTRPVGSTSPSPAQRSPLHGRDRARRTYPLMARAAPAVAPSTVRPGTGAATVT